MSIYSEAALKIKSIAQNKQSELDLIALNARKDNLIAHQNAAIEGVSKNDPSYPIACLLSQTITIGRESDSYPSVNIPNDTTKVLIAAKNAGIVNEEIGALKFYKDFSGIKNTQEEWNIDFNAWNNAKEFKEKQTYSSL